MIILVFFLFFLTAIFAFSYNKISLKSITKNKKNNLMFLLFCFLLFLLAALRPENIDNDYANYLNIYNKINQGIIVPIEPSFYLIVNIVNYVFNNSIFLFIIYALLGITLIYIAIKQLSNFLFLSLLVYISHFFLLHEMTQIRISVASGFMLLAIRPIYERNIKQFLCYVLFAFFFHYSAILLLILWFIPTRNVNRWFYTFLIPAAYLLYFYNISFLSLLTLIPFEILQKRINLYIKLYKIDEIHTNIFNFIQLVHCSLAFFFLWKLPLLKQYNRYIPILLQCYIWSIVTLVIFQDLPVFAFRVSELLGCVEIILIPCFLYIFLSKPIAVIFVEVICLVIFSIDIFYNKLLVM
jgi:hypothetical protein